MWALTCPALLLAAALTLTSSARAQVEAPVLVLASADAPIDVPSFPFDDNPDPSQCGIPQPLGAGFTGIVQGVVDGELVEPMVYLYDSHLRSAVHGLVASGSLVEVILAQSNPVLDFYMVRYRAADGRSVEGWVPAPFLELR